MPLYRVEACDRLAMADVRPLAEPGAAAALPDGPTLAWALGRYAENLEVGLPPALQRSRRTV